MKIYLFLIVAILMSGNVNSQENTIQNPLSFGLTFGFERTQFTGYETYKRDGGHRDENYQILGKNGNGINTKIHTRKSLDGRNDVSLELGISITQFDANSISGWTGEALDTKTVLIPSIGLQIGHNYIIKTEGNFNISLENSVALTNNIKFSDYNLKEINLIWRPGINVEKCISQRNSLTFELNYGFGLINTSENDRYEIRNNTLGLNLGIRRQF